ncbi:hypothetical protein AALP_AA2G010700 [Arabis alpina]|uniref:Uncharacterized protein n=1 Tax=Arabis alpina TaxID=50452 RepID=A0A087HEK0_ARAAL|nr:hypothetical protein AALP_AA2G010700 [Arabis alpina]
MCRGLLVLASLVSFPFRKSSSREVLIRISLGSIRDPLHLMAILVAC